MFKRELCRFDERAVNVRQTGRLRRRRATAASSRMLGDERAPASSCSVWRWRVRRRVFRTTSNSRISPRRAIGGRRAKRPPTGGRGLTDAGAAQTADANFRKRSLSLRRRRTSLPRHHRAAWRCSYVRPISSLVASCASARQAAAATPHTSPPPPPRRSGRPNRAGAARAPGIDRVAEGARG